VEAAKGASLAVEADNIEVDGKPLKPNCEVEGEVMAEVGGGLRESN
jgi:hypothetical protein